MGGCAIFFCGPLRTRSFSALKPSLRRETIPKPDRYDCRWQIYPLSVNPVQAGVMRTAGFRACWAHGEERKFGSANVEAKAPATGSVAQRDSEPS
jgi:hypothetical protein